MSTPGSSPSKTALLTQVLQNAQQAIQNPTTPTGQPVQPFNKVILPLIRRVMPSVIASQIVGVTPMTGPTASIFALRARYGLTKSFPGCECEIRLEIDFDYVVDLSTSRIAEDQSEEILIWVMLHAQSPYNYGLFSVSSDVETHAPMRVWRFTFTDPNEAFEFRMRWS